jgi:FkbM family methyltransferase
MPLRALRRRLAAWLLQRLRFDYRTPSGLVVPVRGSAEWGAFCDVWVDREYDATLAAGFAPGAPALVVDLGANVGYFALRAAEHWLAADAAPGDQRSSGPLQLICIEPGSVQLAALRNRTAGFSTRGISCRIVEGLVGERSGQAVLQPGAQHTADHVAADGPGRRVNYIDLEALLPAGVPVAVLKCDIEGSEYRLIANHPDLLRRTRALAIEWHPGPGRDDAAAAAALRAAGLALVHARTTGSGYRVERWERPATGSPSSVDHIPAVAR